MKIRSDCKFTMRDIFNLSVMILIFDLSTSCSHRLSQGSKPNQLTTCHLIQSLAIGSYQFYAITFRKQEQEQMLLVTDRMGRVRHATQSLANLLDTTVDRLQVGRWLVGCRSSPGESFKEWLRTSLRIRILNQASPEQAL